MIYGAIENIRFSLLTTSYTYFVKFIITVFFLIFDLQIRADCDVLYRKATLVFINGIVTLYIQYTYVQLVKSHAQYISLFQWLK